MYYSVDLASIKTPDFETLIVRVNTNFVDNQLTRNYADAF